MLAPTLLVGVSGSAGSLILLAIWNAAFAVGAVGDLRRQRLRRRAKAAQDMAARVQELQAPIARELNALAAELKPLVSRLASAEVRCPSCVTTHTFSSFDRNRFNCPKCKSDLWYSSPERREQAIANKTDLAAVARVFQLTIELGALKKRERSLQHETTELEDRINAETMVLRRARADAAAERQTRALEASAKSLEQLEQLKWQEKWGRWPK